FQAWMDAGTPGPLGFALFVVLVIPALATVHELGHAAVALGWSRGLVLLSVGRRPPLARGRVGRLAFEWHPIPSFKDAFFGSVRAYTGFGPGRHAVYALAGP